MAHTPLDWHRPERLDDRGPQRLGAVQDDEHALLDVQAAGDQVGEQVGGDRLVLRRAVPEPQRHLHAVRRDPERDDATAALQIDPVEHQHPQPNVLK
jgi:hypothetical protein